MRASNRWLACLIVGILITILSACAPANGAAPRLANTRWRLTAYGEPGSESPVIEGSEVTLHFEAENQASGSGGCNRFEAQYQVSDGRLSFTDLVWTTRACLDEDVEEQEQLYFEALRTAGEFELTEDQLRIWYSDQQGVLNFARVDAP